jgi:hypothetical protein
MAQQINDNNFEILFQKLDEEVENQKADLIFDFNSYSEINQTISLFREYQDTVTEQSYTTFTRS